MPVFCLDIGGTNTRGALFSDEREMLARAQGPGGALSLGVDTAETAIRGVWQEITEHVATEQRQTRVGIGIAGNGLTERVVALKQRLSDFAEITIVGDGYGALLAATEGRPGAMISVGTGVAALRLHEDGWTQSISGWGFPGGDRGSGAWIGLQVMSALTRHFDDVTLDPPMSESFVAQALAIIGHTEEGIQDWLTTGRAWQYARLVPIVVEGCALNDPFCRMVFRSAAQEIADVGRALYPEGDGTVHLMGGLGAAMVDDCADLAPSLTWKVAVVEAVNGLALLADKQAPDERILPRPRLRDA